MTKFLHSKRVAWSIYRKSLKSYWKKLLRNSLYSKLVILQRQAFADVFEIDIRDFAKLLGKHFYQILYLMKLQASSLQSYCKRDPGVDVFLFFHYVKFKSGLLWWENFKNHYENLIKISEICKESIWAKFHYSQTIIFLYSNHFFTVIYLWFRNL